MKKNRIFALAACLTVIAACTEEKDIQTGGLDASKPGVTSFSYDAASSSAKTAGFTWTADAAVSAGATSYTLELTDDITTDKVENGTSVTIVYVPETSAVVSKNIAAGKYYYARIRANYDGFYYSEWTYLGSATNPLVVCVGSGVVEPVFGAPANLKAVATEDSFKVSWDAVAFADSYTFEYKAASAGNWSVIGDLVKTSYEVTGLPAETAYDIRVRAVKGEELSDYSTSSVTTLKPSGMTTAAQFVKFMTTDAPAAGALDEFRIAEDLDLTGVEIPAVETFKGTLNAMGHSIKGLVSDKPLFNLLTGTVKNLVIDASCKFTPAGEIFGVIAGTSEGTITGVVNNASFSKTVPDHNGVLLLAGIVGMNKGTVSKCENTGAITLTSEAGLAGAGASGIAAYSDGLISECVNRGAITVLSQYSSGKAIVGAGEVEALPGIGGITVFGAPGFGINSCDNYGKLTFTQTAIDKYIGRGSVNLNRHQAGGIVANPVGNVENSNNYGDIEYRLATSDGKTMSGSKNEYISCVGGIAGGDYLSKGNNTTSIINCKNEGNINYFSNSSQSNSTVAGIIGWPGVESPQAIVTENCTNTGNIKVDGTVKIRAGGIQGGTGQMVGCTNTGAITIENAHSGSVIGSICGFHSQTHKIEGCVAGGSVTAKVKVDGIAGLIGNNGNAKNSSGANCAVNTVITCTPETTEIGLIVGKFNGKTAEVSLGPVKVAGKINDIEINSGNYAEWLSKSANYDPGMHILTASYGK